MGLAACSDDDNKWGDVDGGKPTMELTSTHLRTEQGRTITFKGTLADNDGISKITLECHDLYLNKTIDLIDLYGEPQKTYELDYTHKIHSDLETKEYTVVVTVYDVGGRSVSQEVLVTMDGDFVPPVFTALPSDEVTVLIKAKTTLPVKFSVEDDKALAWVSVKIPDFNIEEKVTEFADGRTYDFNRSFEVPSQPGSYVVEVTACDALEQTTSFIATYVVQDLPDWEKMYLADVETSAELNSDVFGVPMLVDHVGPFQYRARYYNKTAGTTICFIPQNTDFTPICFAKDKDNPSLLGDDPDNVDRIELTKAGVYYQIDFNTSTRAYSMTTYSVDDAMSPVKHMHYGQADLNTWADWSNNCSDAWWQEWYFGPITGDPKTPLYKMEQDSKNPNLFVIESWPLTAGSMHFCIHNWHHDGWWNYTTWRVDNPEECNKFMYYGSYFTDNVNFTGNADYFQWKYGDDPTFDLSRWNDESYRKNFVPDGWSEPLVKIDGNYRMEFDVHLERAKLTRIE
jgi:hypothetical protein